MYKGNSERAAPKITRYIITNIRYKAERQIPIIAQILPALRFPTSEYPFGFSLRSCLSFLEIIRAIMPQISPGIPQQQLPTIEQIPNTRAVVALGNFCCN